MENRTERGTKNQGVDIMPYKMVFDASPAAFALLHVLLVDGKYDDFVFEYANKGYENMSGFTVEALNGHTYSEVCGKKSEQWNSIYGKVAYEGSPITTIEYGSEINRYVNIQCYQIKEGYCAILVLDVNNQIEAEKKVNQEYQRKYELERYRIEHDSNLLAYAIFNISKNVTLEIVRGEKLEEIDKTTLEERFFNDVAGDIVYGHQRNEYLHMASTDFLYKEHENGSDEHIIEFQRKLPSGKVIWVRSRFYLLEEPTSGELILYYTCNDIDERKSLEVIMGYISNTDYDMIGSINFQDDSAIFLYGENSSREDGNIGLRREENYTEALEWFVGNAVVPEEREQYKTKFFIQKIRDELSKNHSYEFLVHVYGKKGELLTKRIRYASYDMNTEVCFFTQTDVTILIEEQEQKQKELSEALEDAKRANQAKTTFLSRMSHDMRTPMNGVLGLADLMMKETDVDVIHGDLKQLKLSGNYLLQLINDTLDMSKIESGKMELNLHPIDSAALFENILSNASIMAKNKGVILEIDTPQIPEEQFVPVIADDVRLEQVIMNIVSNAIKFTPPGNKVEMIMESVSITEKEVIDRYIIRDTGIGISKEFLPHVFEAFAQEGRSNRERENGTGLGMSIVKQLVDLMGGEITIESELGKGTEVTILMHYPVSQSEVISRNSVKIDTQILGGKRILLCEDHPLNAQIAQRLLETQNIQVELAENGLEGVEKFADSTEGYFDVILMDVRMPVMDGLEATKRIRELSREDAKKIPIIAMTANAYQDDVESCKNAGMDAHIAKPIESTFMFNTIAECLMRSR